ncbi:MAG: SPOR domain-containing protein, partial [Dokdonella sp.]
MKQRLLGAAVLIALAIIFVPMIFSGSGPVQESTTVDLEIPPAPDREFETRVMTVDANNRDPGATPLPARTADPVIAVDAPSPAQPEPVPGPVAVTAEVPEPATTSTAATKPEAPVATLAGVAASGNFFVHLGVYAAASNATELVDVLKRAGLPAFAEATQFEGKAAQRVRVGPYASRSEAEATRIRIKQLKPDVPGSVVARSADATADAPASAVAAT